MSIKMFMLAGVLGISMLTGCAALSDHWTVVAIDGAALSDPPKQYEAAIASYLDDNLKDPTSRQIKNLSGPKATYIARRIITKQPSLLDVNGTITEIRDRVWMVSIDVNARNGYGGYSGWQRYEFYFNSESVQKVINRTAEAEQADLAFQRMMLSH